jgi:hypothetical protein
MGKIRVQRRRVPVTHLQECQALIVRRQARLNRGADVGVGHVAVKHDELLEGGELREVEAVWGVVFDEN